MHTRVRGVETRPSPLSSFLLTHSHVHPLLCLLVSTCGPQVRCLEESSSCLVDALQPRLLELLRHLSYGVRFEAAVTLQVHTCPSYIITCILYHYIFTILIDLSAHDDS